MNKKKASKKTQPPRKSKKKSSKKKVSARTSSSEAVVESMDDSVEEAPFMLVVQVLAQGAATMDEVPIDGGTFVVGVVETLASIEAIGDLAGFEITLQYGPAGLELGETYLVHAQSWLYGDGIALLATRVAPYSDVDTQAVVESLEEAPRVAVLSRAAEAELVASGKVVSIKEVGKSENEPVTEHDPQWREAVVEIESVERSASRAKPEQVTVRFAASDDAEWVDAPKVSVGDRRVFMLGNARKEKAAASRAVSGARSDEYSLLESGDALPIEVLDDLRKMMQGDEQ